MIKCDVATLADNIDLCFDRSLDQRLTEPQRDGYLQDGKNLRSRYVNLVSARFSDGTQAVADADAELDAVNQQLKADSEAIDNAVSTLDNIGRLVGVLDELLKIAASFL